MQVQPRESILPASVVQWLVENKRGDEIEAYEEAYAEIYDADVPENKLMDTIESFEAGETGHAALAYKPFERPDWRSYAAEVLRLQPNDAQREIAALEAGFPDEKRTLDEKSPRFTADQGRFLDSIDRYKRTACGAGNSVGKSDAVAVAARYLYDKGYKVIIVANTFHQVNDIIFAYIRTQNLDALPGSGGYLYPEAPKMRYTPEHTLQGLATETKAGEMQVKGMAGRHFRRVAVIIEEAQGAMGSTIRTANQMATGPEDKIVMIYNPTDPGCAARKAIQVRRKKDGGLLWNEVRINGENHPNVVYDREIIPGAVSREFVESTLDVGVTRESALYRSSVLGEWPDDSPDALIERKWVLDAMARGATPRPNDWRGKALGVDVAGEGSDLTNGWCVARAKAYMPRIDDSRILARYPHVRRGYAWHSGRVITACEQLIYATLQSDPDQDIRHVGIDDTGLGQGVRANLSENHNKKASDGTLNFPSYIEYHRTDKSDLRKIQVAVKKTANWTGFIFGASPNDPADERFVMVKHQLLWHLRERLRLGEFDLPTAEELRSYGLPDSSDLVEQLTRCIYGVSAEKKLIVMDKRSAGAPTETMRKQAEQLPHDSPDLLHALAMACWVYFKILKPGTPPIETAQELQAVERERIVAKMIREKRNPLRRSNAKLPWQRVRKT